MAISVVAGDLALGFVNNLTVDPSPASPQFGDLILWWFALGGVTPNAELGINFPLVVDNLIEDGGLQLLTSNFGDRGQHAVLYRFINGTEGPLTVTWLGDVEQVPMSLGFLLIRNASLGELPEVVDTQWVLGDNSPQTAPVTQLTAGITVAFCSAPVYQLIDGPAGWTLEDRGRTQNVAASRQLSSSVHTDPNAAGVVGVVNYVSTELPGWVVTTLAVNGLEGVIGNTAVVEMVGQSVLAPGQGPVLTPPAKDRSYDEPVSEPPTPSPLVVPGRPYTEESGEPHR